MKHINRSIATIAAAPAAVHGWSIGPPMFTAPLFLHPSSFMEEERSLLRRMFDLQAPERSSPGHYELVDDKDKFQVSVAVPGIKMEDIDVRLEDGYISISGERVVTTETSRSASKFSQAFSLDPTVDLEHLTATLNNGVLVVSAPKIVEKLEEKVRKIPIALGAPETSVAQADTSEATRAEKEPATVKEA